MRVAPLGLRDGDRERLTSLMRSSSVRAGLAQRARIVLLAAEGASNTKIADRPQVGPGARAPSWARFSRGDPRPSGSQRSQRRLRQEQHTTLGGFRPYWPRSTLSRLTLRSPHAMHLPPSAAISACFC